MSANHLYIVSFGDSRKYRYETLTDLPAAACGETPLRHDNPFEAIESRLRAELEKKFPGQPVAYFVSAKATEVDCDHSAEYASYPPLDEAAEKNILAQLEKEIRERDDLEQLNSNAPFADAPV